MEGTGVCIACGASDVELNDEKKCPHCTDGAQTTSETAPPEASAEGGDMPATE